MTDDEYCQEHQADSMLLWRCHYDLDGKFTYSTWVSYIWSTSAPTVKDMQYHWDAIYPQGYKVENFSTCAVPPRDDSELAPRMIESINKEINNG